MTIDELGGITEAERDKLAADLRREMGRPEREHVTDGSPCWCGPTLVDPDDESQIELANSTDEPVHSQVLGPPLVELPTARFGDRLRRYLNDTDPTSPYRNPLGYCGSEGIVGEEIEAIADAIDQDAAVVLAAYHDGLLKIYEEEVVHARKRIEEAVERLRHTVQGPGADGDWLEQKDVLDVEPFLDELGRIFSSRTANMVTGADSGPVEPPTVQVIDLMSALKESMWAEAERRYGTAPAATATAANRRERASARNEHTDGRVVGVDR